MSKLKVVDSDELTNVKAIACEQEVTAEVKERKDPQNIDKVISENIIATGTVEDKNAEGTKQRTKKRNRKNSERAL